MVYHLSQALSGSARLHPNKAAFVCGTKTFTYQEVEEKTNQLALYLQGSGVRKGDRVGVYLNRSIELSIAVYGILKLGAVYVPLDTTASSSRTSHLLNDCDINFLVSNPVHLRQLKELVKEKSPLQEVIGIAEGALSVKTTSWQSIFALPMKEVAINIVEDDLAYVIYTSGSTGTPKGIMHTHRSGLGYAKLAAALYGLTHEDRIANHSPLHFDISTFAFFAGVLVGATMIVIPESYTKMPASLAGMIHKENISVWYSVPLALVQMLENNLLNDSTFSSLRWVLYAGEVFPVKHLNALMKQWSHARFSNVYGPTELNQCTYYHLPAPPENEVPLGWTWENTEQLIVNENDIEVDKGEVGELLVRSVTMMAGYWKQPLMTQKSIFKKVLESGHVLAYYRTGDLVKQNASGELIFLGRKDRQVKVRGYRIELDEIAHHLNNHYKVKEAAVYTQRNEKDELSIEVSVVPVDTEIIESKTILEYLKLYLPVYALPQSVQFLKDFPRTSTGKIDYRSLATFNHQKE